MSPWYNTVLLYVAAAIVLMGDVVLQSTVLPDRPGLAFFLSLCSRTAGTIIMTWLGREPF
jgi:hypothetical protein